MNDEKPIESGSSESRAPEIFRDAPQHILLATAAIDANALGRSPGSRAWIHAFRLPMLAHSGRVDRVYSPTVAGAAPALRSFNRFAHRTSRFTLANEGRKGT